MLSYLKALVYLLLIVSLSDARKCIAAEAKLTGDAEAIGRMNKMFERLGGRDTWASARSLYIMERARHVDYGDGIVATFWRDLEHPGEKGELRLPQKKVIYGWYICGW